MSLRRTARSSLVTLGAFLSSAVLLVAGAAAAWAAISSETVINVGVTSGYGVTASADGNYVYVAGGSQNKIARISTSDNSYILSAVVGSSTQLMALSPDGSKLYAPLYSSNSIKVINTSTMVVENTWTVPAGTGPFGVTVSPQGDYLLVTGYNVNNVSKINTSTGATTTFATCNSPIDVELTSDGQTFFVTCHSSNQVGAYNVTNGSSLGTITVGSSPYSAVLSPDDSRLFVVNSSSNSVSVINTSNRTVLQTISTGTGPRFIAMSPDGSTLAVSGYNPGILELYNTQTYALQQSLSPSQAPYLEQVAFAGNGASLWLADQGAGRVSRWDINPPLYTPPPTPTPTPTPTASTEQTLSATGFDSTPYFVGSGALLAGGVIALAVGLAFRRRSENAQQ